MSNFKIVEIIDATTVKVYPAWVFDDVSGSEISDDKVKILGLAVPPNDNEYAKNRLSSLLLDREVELVNPEIINTNGSGIIEIACNIIIDKTDISYYFPEYSSNTRRAAVFF